MPLPTKRFNHTIDHCHPAIARSQINHLYNAEEEALENRATFMQSIDFCHPAVARAQINGFHEGDEKVQVLTAAPVVALATAPPPSEIL
ncbi:hypothetical protein HDU98_010335 [Podochytrium sp. JEL0797]|nr:hypothetical protein HDU98_010335 [Podochytrium sp. JEL0797]